ncbi:hypothetical protein MMC14_007020 [Varicellaria rhodocarpa]|nr:hypothetical protein [Varicellaria rhodocarpa]
MGKAYVGTIDDMAKPRTLPRTKHDEQRRRSGAGETAYIKVIEEPDDYQIIASDETLIGKNRVLFSERFKTSEQRREWLTVEKRLHASDADNLEIWR